MSKNFKKLSFLWIYFFFSLPLLFAQQDIVPPGMQTLADNILRVFAGNFIRVLLAIFLCGSAIAYAFNKDNEKIKRNCIAIGVASAILVVAQTLITLIWNAAGG